MVVFRLWLLIAVLRCAFSEATLVLMVMAMIGFLQALDGRSTRGRM